MFSNQASTPRRPKWTEVVRILILVAAALCVISPFMTALRLGGVDAFWYANMVRGVTDQIAAGHFPVPVGQGPLAWNGGVHPFRTAPVFIIVATLWDVVTFGRLGEFTLEHLAAITSAVVGTLGFYLAATKIMPARRWTSLAFALLYLAAPAWLAVVINVEDYMSYMAFAAMPLVLYGNARTVLEPDGKGYIPLGAGMALIWMCHPPIAFLTSISTLFIQAGLAAFRGFAPWRNLAASAGVFVVLSAYYFASMSELPRMASGGSMSTELRTILGLALFFIGIGRLAVSSNKPIWAACALVGGVVVGLGSKPWLIWICFAAAIWIVTVLLSRALKWTDFRRNAFALLFICALAAAAAAELIAKRHDYSRFELALITLGLNTASLPGLLRPLPTPFGGVPILQLGWGLDLAIVVGALSLFGKRPLGSKLFAAAVVSLVILFIRVPVLSDFLVGYFPIDLAAMCGLPLALRIMPVIAGFSAMAGVLWMAALPDSGRWSKVAPAAVMLLAAWGCWQTARFIQTARTLTSTPAQTTMDTRPENMALARYAYDLMHLPDYYSNGVDDPRLETRLLDGYSNEVLIGPTQIGQIVESKGSKRLHLTCTRIPNSNWSDMSPKFTVEPGEHLLLRFEFDPSHHYNGYMFMYAEHAYREYHLPDAGLSLAFGIGDARTSVISLWNSGTTAEHYHLSTSPEPGNDIVPDGGNFCDLVISEFKSDGLPIRLESLIPYRASVSSTTGGWLETFVLYLPGYRAWLDGNPVSVGKSAQQLAEIKVPPGDHTVELRFVGTTRLRLAALLSAAGWVGLCLIGIRSIWLGRRSPAA
jgi:hypothetical protein